MTTVAEDFDNRAVASEQALRRALVPLNAADVVKAIAIVMRRPEASAHPPMWFGPLLCHVAAAACAYARGTTCVDRDHLRHLQGLAMRCGDVALEAALAEAGEEGLSRFFLALTRSQLLAQGGLSTNVPQRTIAMFEPGLVPKSVAHAFERGTRIPLGRALEMSMSLLLFGKVGTLKLEVADMVGWFRECGTRPEATAAFLEMASWTIDELGTAYRQSRRWDHRDADAQRRCVAVNSCPNPDRVPPRLWLHQAIGLVERPLVRIGTAVTAPIPTVCEGFVCDFPWRIAKAADDEDAKHGVGELFQAYVGRVLAELPNIARIIGAEAITQTVGQGSKGCDFTVVGPDYTLLVECKSAQWASRVSTMESLHRSGAFGVVAKGLRQLTATVTAIHEGRFGPDVPPRVVPLIATLGVLPQLNHPMTRQAIVKLAEREGADLSVLRSLETEWQVLDIGALDSLICTCLHDGTTPPALVTEYEAAPWPRRGGWSSFLYERRGGAAIPGLALWQAAAAKMAHVFSAGEEWIKRTRHVSG